MLGLHWLWSDWTSAGFGCSSISRCACAVCSPDRRITHTVAFLAHKTYIICIYVYIYNMYICIYLYLFLYLPSDWSPNVVQWFVLQLHLFSAHSVRLHDKTHAVYFSRRTKEEKRVFLPLHCPRRFFTFAIFQIIDRTGGCK